MGRLGCVVRVVVAVAVLWTVGLTRYAVLRGRGVDPEPASPARHPGAPSLRQRPERGGLSARPQVGRVVPVPPRAKRERHEPHRHNHTQPTTLEPAAEIHVAFSTDCKAFQDWQSAMVWSSAALAGHIGPITRIASGCASKSQEAELLHASKPWPNARVHFTPKFSTDTKTGREYHFYNKPRGILHWLTHGRPEADIIALIDPDQFFLRPLTPDLAGVPNLVVTDPVKKETLPTRIGKGAPAAQFYGLGDRWLRFNREYICGAGSPCLEATSRDAWRSFTVGPPYILHVDDWKRLARSWVDFVPKVYEEYPHLLAEMYAYSLAAAHEELPHFRVNHLMVSNVGSYGEGWPLVDSLPSVCADALRPSSNTSSAASMLPTFIHACQSYHVGRFRFSKRALPTDKFSSCDAEFLHEPPETVLSTELQEIVTQIAQGPRRKKTNEEKKAVEEKRNGFMVCMITKLINEAMRVYRKGACRM